LGSNMPMYEYQCRACEHEFEVLQKISDKALVHCPDSGKPELRKKISAAAFRLKGGGWYETDFKTGDKKNLAGEADATKKSDSGSSGEAKAASNSDTTTPAPKPAASTE